MHSYKSMAFNQSANTPIRQLTTTQSALRSKQIQHAAKIKINTEALSFLHSDFVKTFNEFLDEHCRDKRIKKKIKLGFSDDFQRYPLLSPTFARMFDAIQKDGSVLTFDGYMNYRDNIEAAVKIIISLLTTDKHIALDAPTQCGKTTILIIAANIYALTKAVDDKLEETVISLIPFHEVNAFDDTSHDNKMFNEVYGNIRMGGKLLCSVGNGEGIIDKRRNLRVVLEDAISKNQTEICNFLDEADYGSAVEGVLDKYITAINVHNAESSENKIQLRLVSLSATPFEFMDCSRFEHVKVTKSPGSGYRGICQGDQIAIHGFSEIGKHFELRNLQDMDNIKLTNPEILSDIAQFIKKISTGCLATNFNLRGKPFNGGNAIAIRVAKGEKPELIKEALKKLKGLCFFDKEKPGTENGIRFIDYYERGLRDNGKPTKLDKLIADQSKKYIIFLKGAARRASRFPASCAVFIDLTYKYGTGEAFYQGLIGRATGYKGDNIFVAVSDFNKSLVDVTRAHFKATGEEVPARKLSRAVLGSSPYQKDDYYKRISLVDGPLPVELREIITQRLYDQVVPNVQYNKKMHHNNPAGYSIIDLLGGEEGFSQIEKTLSEVYQNPVKLLRPGECVFHNGNWKQYPMKGENPNTCKVAVANEKRVTGASRDKTKDTRRPSLKGQANNMGEANIEFSFNTNKEPQSFVVWFANGVVSNATAHSKTVFETTDKSTYLQWY